MSVISPHKAVSPETISRWLKQVLSEAGIDTIKYSAHSTRAAAATKAGVKLDVANILASVGWKSSHNFERFYRKPRELGMHNDTTEVADSACFAAAVMSRDDHE